MSSASLDQTANKPFHRDPPDGPVTVPPAAAHGIAAYSPEAAATMTLPPKPPRIDQLFHDPALPPSAICPQRFPGIDPESTDALIRTLAHNHVSWHIFFNYKGFHNHASHHLLCIWAMGASGAVIDAAYATHCVYQRPAFESPGHITHANYNKHVGDERYYSAYLRFFESELLKRGLSECLEEYVFSLKANFNNGGEHPAMLSRFIYGVIHPFIHVGCGAEFGLLGVSAEGLAMAAVHPCNLDLLHRAWFPDVISEPDQKCNALSILSLVACDPRFSYIKRIEDGKILAQGLKEYGAIIREYVEMWKFDIISDIGIADTAEELSWVNSIIFGVGGHLSSQEFRADFLLVHLLNSSLFLPSLLASIPGSSSRRLLLLTYFTMSLTYYVARGRPTLDLRGFYSATEHLLHRVPGPGTSPAPGTLPNPSSDLAQTPNTWLRLFQSVVVHPNEHLCKAQRALAHYSSLYGKRRKGWTTSLSASEDRRVSPTHSVAGDRAEDEVGLAELDGTLFLRVAMLTQNRLGWIREGEPEHGWDFDGFYAPDDA